MSKTKCPWEVEKLFQFISKLDTAFLAVSWDTHSSLGGPEQFLNEQMQLWSKYWHPSNQEQDHQNPAVEYSDLWEAAKQESFNSNFYRNLLENALKGYRKETMGSDIWKPSESGGLPGHSKRK